MIDPGASSETVPWMIAAATSGALFSFVAFWAKGQIERITGAESKIEHNADWQVERDFGQVEAIATLRAEVTMLKDQNREERERCSGLVERVARLESFQAWAEPLLERATAGLEKAVAFEAMFGEQLKTLFKGQAAVIAKLERMVPATAH